MAEQKIRMVLSNWTYQDYMDFVLSFSEGNTEKSYRLAQKLIGSWDYEADLNDPNAFLNLPIKEATMIVATVLEQCRVFAEDIDFSEMEVDLHWTTARFLEFDKARQDHNIRKVESMMLEICSKGKKPLKSPLSFEEGAKMMAAILAEYKKLISGKN